jgi:putative methionine-R-sulfoxide reductase with GAF domain
LTDQKNKPVLDEQTFERLLEAAYVMQEHNRKMMELEQNLESQSERLREQESAVQLPPAKGNPESEGSSRADSDYTLTLAEIVEAQHQIQRRHLELDKAMEVVAERVARITGASGAAIGILEGKMVRYRAGAGAPALPLGTEVPLATAICHANVRTGQVIRTEDVDTEFLFDPEPCRQRGIRSLVAVPIYHDGNITGALELYFDKIRGYGEQDIHTCQLMAGLVTEAIGRDAESKLKKSMAAERSTMLAAIERLQPNLVAWAEDQSAAAAPKDKGASSATPPVSPCWKCGTKLPDEELFCGSCGAPRAANGEPSTTQNDPASVWDMPPSPQAFAAEPSGGTPLRRETKRSTARHTPKNKAEEEGAGDSLPELFSVSKLEESDPLSTLSFSAGAIDDAIAASPSFDNQLGENEDEDKDNDAAPSTALVKPKPEDVVWSSASRARDFLESLSATRTPGAIARFWRSRRGDFYLAVAVILVVVVIRWGIWSNHSVGASARGTVVSGNANRVKQPVPDAGLSAFDKFLIGLGLAEAPEPPQYKGNPDTQVWLDLQTALYYCPGSDLYGKTPNGKLTSQRDAQLDQFEPADRKPCD